MPSLIIPTARLNLVLQTPDEVITWVESLPPADRAEVSPDWIARVKATKIGDPWALSFKMVERSSGAVVGGCAFKGPPDADGTVEIAYGTEADFRQRGFATEAAAALTVFALGSGQVRAVRAHTKTDNEASARVLIKCCFRQIGLVFEPEDGVVMRWERTNHQSGTESSRADHC